MAKGIHSELDQKTARPRWKGASNAFPGQAGIVFPANDRVLEASTELRDAARPAIDLLSEQLRETQEKIDAVTAWIEAAQKSDPLARRLAAIPGLGAITASVIAATTPEVGNFRTARDLFVGETVPQIVS